VIVWFALRNTEPQRLRRAWFRNTPLKERFPNRREAWYLKKILSDLQRDRR
jgi:hypothetical protein